MHERKKFRLFVLSHMSLLGSGDKESFASQGFKKEHTATIPCVGLVGSYP
jgi:hypothetical protein